MKKVTCVLVLALISAIVFGQTSVVQNTGKDDFEKMTFEVGLNKNSFVISEPIFIKFKFSNHTGVPQMTYSPAFIGESELKVSSRSKTLTHRNLSAFNGISGVRFPLTVPPAWVSTKDEILTSPFTGYIFPISGEYQLQFILRSSGSEKTIKSNIINITIEKPTGINKDALDFMKEHQEFFGLSSWTDDGKNSLALLQEFVSKYDQSAYGEPAISALADIYESKNELDKAQIEFEKIKSSKNKLIADEANKALENIKERKACLLRQKQP